MNLSPFGSPSEAAWSQQSLSDCAGVLESLTEREVERMEENGAAITGDGALNVRLDLIERARELIEVADAGNLKIMRQEWQKVKSQATALKIQNCPKLGCPLANK